MPATAATQRVGAGGRCPVTLQASRLRLEAFRSTGHRLGVAHSERAPFQLPRDYVGIQPFRFHVIIVALNSLERVRAQGFAFDVGEHLEGHNCLGAPILGPEGEAIASLWISGPSQRLSEERMQDIASTVKKAGEMVTFTLNPKANAR